MIKWLHLKAILLTYWFEQQSGELWSWACPDDQASCWLDFLPALFVGPYSRLLQSYVKKYHENIYGYKL